MNILFLSYGQYEYDGRQRELIKVCKQLGKTYYLTCTEKNFTPAEPEHICFQDTSRFAYLHFVRRAVRLFEELGNIDLVFADNRKATLPALRIQKKHPGVRIVQDARELYLRSEMKSISGYMGCVFEEKLYKKANVVIAANEFRAQYMQKEYGLAKKPLVYENLRKLSYAPDADLEKIAAEFAPLLEGEEWKIISTSGCSVERTNDKLVAALEQVHYPCKLFLVGGSTQQERENIESIAQAKGLTQVHILGQMGQNQLKYLIDHCQIGIVNYGQYDSNNIYCASGKLYEFLYEGKPVVTTSNPPLQDMCRRWGVGEASDDYATALNKVIGSYDEYCLRVKQAAQCLHIEDNNQNIVEQIKRELGLQ